MQNAPDEILQENQNAAPQTPNLPPVYSKCLTCADYGTTCWGFDLVSLGDINTVRAYHRAIKKARTLSLKAIAAAAPTISESTINEYFSNVEKDYKWTTVVAIDAALLSICGHRVGIPQIDHSCPAAASEYRDRLTAAEMKLAAADLNLATALTECESLRRCLADSDQANIAQIAEIRKTHQDGIVWLKHELKLWRRIAFILLGVGLVVLCCLLLYVGWDIFNPDHGFIRH